MSKKVLLVDDTVMVLMMQKMILSESPFAITTASDGAEPIMKAPSEQSDVILLDDVTKLDGLCACAAIRRDAATAHISHSHRRGHHVQRGTGHRARVP